MNADDPESERDSDELDDIVNREELRQRYYGLLQELRVILPGVQVLLAFMLTAPFAARFDQLDDVGRVGYFVALVSAMGSIITLLTPTVFHRIGDRTARSARLVWGIRMTLIGVSLLALALTAALWSVVRLVFSTPLATVVAATAAVAFALCWIAVPLSVRRTRRPR